MNLNIHKTQNDFGVYQGNSTEMSLDQIMSVKAKTAQATAKPEVARKAGAPGIASDSPGDERSSIQPISKEEQLFMEFRDKALDGTQRSRKELAEILKNMAKKLGIPDYDLGTKKYALMAAIKGVDDGLVDSASLRKELMGEFSKMWYGDKVQTRVLERMLKPTRENGGLDMMGRNLKEWYKHK